MRKHAFQMVVSVPAMFLLCIFFLAWTFPRDLLPSAGSVAAISEPPSSPAAASPAAEPEPQPVVQTVRFSATGDNLIHSPIYKQAKRRAAGTEGYSFDYCYEHIAPFYAQQDVNWINQETLCTDELEPSTYPCFSTPGDCARALYRAGVREDVVTTGLWKGESDYGRIPMQTVNGVTIAYLSYTEHTNGIPQSKAMTANIIYTSQTDVIEQQVRSAHQLADFVVVGVHWGVENSHTVVDAQRALAQSLADWGADLIIGTHPHVLQNAQWLTAADGRQVFTAYSLGNFISTQEKPDQLVGAILSVQLEKTTEPDGTVRCSVLSPRLLPTVTHYDAGKSNVRTYLFRDYTEALTKAHGVRQAYPDFSLEMIQSIARENIDPEFLQLT